ncbi:unnamed protein product [Albugo candida]|uniref:Uncharacterized protein n=1 Tax=Albugo candida TaxID=65357 RepID=A0A024GBD8_9STRA|nr:unnamed protein product [Albugo candida]|eukprot:CCI43652.1 unnamed protein product [Albugo candida]
MSTLTHLLALVKKNENVLYMKDLKSRLKEKNIFVKIRVLKSPKGTVKIPRSIGSFEKYSATMPSCKVAIRLPDPYFCRSKLASMAFDQKIESVLEELTAIENVFQIRMRRFPHEQGFVNKMLKTIVRTSFLQEKSVGKLEYSWSSITGTGVCLMRLRTIPNLLARWKRVLELF